MFSCVASAFESLGASPKSFPTLVFDDVQLVLVQHLRFRAGSMEVFDAWQACALNKSTIAILLLQASLLVATGGSQNSSASHDDM